MINRQTLDSAGVTRTFINGSATLVASALPGKLYDMNVTSTGTVTIFAQLYDAPTVAAAESAGVWVGNGPIIQYPVHESATLSPATQLRFDPPIALNAGCVVLVSTSATGFVADTGTANISVSFVPDYPSTLGRITAT